MLACCCCLVNQQDWSRQSSLCEFNPYNRVPLLQVSTLFFTWAWFKQPPPPSSFLHHSSSSQPFQVHSAGELRSHSRRRFPPSAWPSPGWPWSAPAQCCSRQHAGHPKGVVERLLLAVLQHWDPLRRHHEDKKHRALILLTVKAFRAL